METKCNNKVTKQNKIVIEATEENVLPTLVSTKLTLIFMYCPYKWYRCHVCEERKIVYNNAADIIAKEIPPGKLVMMTAPRFSISKLHKILVGKCGGIVYFQDKRMRRYKGGNTTNEITNLIRKQFEGKPDRRKTGRISRKPNQILQNEELFEENDGTEYNSDLFEQS